MKRYYRVMLGRKSMYAAECFEGGYIAIGQVFGIDLSSKLPDEWREFNKEFIPVFLQANPTKTKIGAGLACGALWTVCKGIRVGDIVLCPDGQGNYHVGEVTGGYFYGPQDKFPHKRPVKWLDVVIARSAMSEALQNSTGSIGTVSDITSYGVEIDQLLGSLPPTQVIVSTNPEIEDPVSFAMEKHLEAFLVSNWNQTVLGKEYDVFEEDGELVGQQYATDVGPIDILAVSKDKKRLLVVELKRGRASDVVVGQVLRYMGFIKEQVAEADQTIEGVIIALENDIKLKYALMAVPNLSFYRYQVSFKLVQG